MVKRTPTLLDGFRIHPTQKGIGKGTLNFRKIRKLLTKKSKRPEEKLLILLLDYALREAKGTNRFRRAKARLWFVKWHQCRLCGQAHWSFRNVCELLGVPGLERELRWRVIQNPEDILV